MFIELTWYDRVLLLGAEKLNCLALVSKSRLFTVDYISVLIKKKLEKIN